MNIKSDRNFDNSTLDQFRTWMFRIDLSLIAIFYPSWYIIYYLIQPAMVDDLSGRLLVSGLALSFLALSFVKNLKASTLEAMFTFAGIIMIFHAFHMGEINNLSFPYVLGCILAFFAVTLGFLSHIYILIYSVCSIGYSLTIDSTNAQVPKLVFIGVLVTLAVVAFVTFRIRYHLMRSLQSSRQRLQEVLDFLPVGTAYYDRGQFYVNRIAENLLDVKESDFDSSKDYSDFLTKNLKPYSSNEIENIEQTIFSLTTHTGQEKLVQCATYQVPDLKIWILLDETEKLVARANMIHSAKMASLGTMAAGIAHEINNPLTIIKGFAHMLGRKMQRADLSREEQVNLANSIMATVDRIESIVKALKHFSRQGNREKMMPISLKEIIQRSVDLCQEKLDSLFIKFEINLPNESILVKCHPIDITQILVNLINNSADAILGQNEPWIQLKTLIEGDFISISVIDSGKGIEKEIVSRIFEPFFTTKDVGKGTGLGLSISQGLAQQNSGKLVYDASTTNTCFKLTLPIYKELSGDAG